MLLFVLEWEFSYHRVVPDEPESAFSDLISKRDGFRSIFLAMLNELGLELWETLPIVMNLNVMNARGKTIAERALTSDSWGNSVTNAMNSSHPAFRLIGFGTRFFNTSAPSLSAWTSSNIVPASDWVCEHSFNWLLSGGTTHHRISLWAPKAKESPLMVVKSWVFSSWIICIRQRIMLITHFIVLEKLLEARINVEIRMLFSLGHVVNRYLWGV